ncbi:uncharacterized protein LTR77_009970 [Saxophila tyrrhenica]|uniref:Uncharacterized protein n=1 Tax=Saxophila tyrrhenica TaxID=1690608 RepID=A0AAV9NWU7_9PEZI|nr:hypothetical protein LTR77_009970 [Saxophila tyrrhenica]
MPPRRRLNPISAAALPVSRLPVGTPQVATSSSPPDQSRGPTKPPQLKGQRSDLSLEKNVSSATDKESNSPTHSFLSTMPPNAPSHDVSAKSIAEAKLERQRAKYEEADAARQGPLPLDRRAQTSRGKNTRWKPFDFTADGATPRPQDEGGAPVEVRVNTFRPASRAPSLARSASVLSHRTSDTGHSDIERQDSMLTDSGFQVYQGRKGRKQASQLDAYESKPEPRQTTVEAEFDNRDVRQVFGGDLPGPSFIEQHPGYKNGQLQFLQHPNGDVSAHQWSTDRYQWENIGQYSNIRKKLEGQLASDRLKGETAYQTLQRNTLAYFRIVAKQREANVEGLEFGPKEIQAAIPEPPSEQPAAYPTTLSGANREDGVKEATLHQSQHASPQIHYTTHHHPATENTPRPSLPPQFEQYAQYQSRNSFNGMNPNFSVYGSNRENSLYLAPRLTGPYNQVYGQLCPQHLDPRFGPVYRPNYPSRSLGLNYDFHFPPTSSAAARTPYDGHSVAGSPYQHRLANQREDPPKQIYRFEGSNAPEQNQPSRQTACHIGPDEAEASSTVSQPLTELAAPQPQHAVPFNPRIAARDQLWKLPETAKERSQSQANIRTVLFDPFQSESTPEKPKQATKEDDQESTTAFSRRVAGRKLQPPPTLTPSLSRFFPTGLVPPLPKSSSPTGSTTTNILQNSSPDPPPSKQSYTQTTPLITRTAAPQPTPQTLQAPFFPSELPTNPAIASDDDTTKTPRETYDARLHEWYTSGTTFVRHEALCQTMQSSSASDPNDTRLDITRLLIPVLENLSAYTQGLVEKRKDYFCPWSKPAEWMVDRGGKGNESFYDAQWGTPPARVGRDSRYAGTREWSGERLRSRRGRGNGTGWQSVAGAGGGGLVGGRFAFGGRY